MENCSKLLEASLKRAQKNLGHSFIHDVAIAARIAAVVNCPSNRAGVRLLMACMLAKVHRPEIDPRKPYTKIGSKDCFSGRSYDEQFIGGFITKHNLPCNSTTAFLTPTLRNMDQTLTTKVVLVGRPMAMYQSALQLLDDVRAGRVSAQDILNECLRLLLLDRDARKARLKTLLSGVGPRGGCAATVIRGYGEFDRATSSLQRFKPFAGIDCCRRLRSRESEARRTRAQSHRAQCRR